MTILLETQRHYITSLLGNCQEALHSWQLLAVGFQCLFEGKMLKMHENEGNHIQNFHLGRYIAGYKVTNHVLWPCVAVKLNFQPNK